MFYYNYKILDKFWKISIMDSSAYIFYKSIYRLVIYIQSANKIFQKSIENAQLTIPVVPFKFFSFRKLPFYLYWRVINEKY